MSTSGKLAAAPSTRTSTWPWPGFGVGDLGQRQHLARLAELAYLPCPDRVPPRVPRLCQPAQCRLFVHVRSTSSILLLHPVHPAQPLVGVAGPAVRSTRGPPPGAEDACRDALEQRVASGLDRGVFQTHLPAWPDSASMSLRTPWGRCSARPGACGRGRGEPLRAASAACLVTE